MIEAITAGASTLTPANNINKSQSGSGSGVQLDLETIPENKVKLDGPASAGEGRGLVLDVKA